MELLRRMGSRSISNFVAAIKYRIAFESFFFFFSFFFAWLLAKDFHELIFSQVFVNIGNCQDYDKQTCIGIVYLPFCYLLSDNVFIVYVICISLYIILLFVLHFKNRYILRLE